MPVATPQPWKIRTAADPVRVLRDGVTTAARLARSARPLDMGKWAYVASAGSPCMEIENKAFENEAFRKMHIEVARRADPTDYGNVFSDDVDILHAVFIPHASMDVPILSMDMVSINGRVSMAIADPSPLGEIPGAYRRAVTRLQANRGVISNRAIPDWGTNIFSDMCVLCQPRNEREVDAFINYASSLALYHVAYCANQAPAPASKLPDLERARATYVRGHMKNDKTRRMLETHFGEDFAREYMATVMFDV